MRHLVICCDGTWNTPDQKDTKRGNWVVPSNVVKMARAVDTTMPKEGSDIWPRQIVYYDKGVGTGGKLDKFLGGLTGKGLSINIKQAYRWLAETYKDGDKLFLFGFSRGAYTARSLAGMLCTVGLAKDPAETDKAFTLYRKLSSKDGKEKAEAFRAENRPLGVYFLGVWDTVGALGVPFHLVKSIGPWLAKVFGKKNAHQFHDVTLSEKVHYAYHAIALDERRGPFKPSLWKAKGDGTDPAPDHVQQAWFAGVHSNIGGGYVDAGLADHAFMWMAKHAMRASLWLDELYLAMRVDPNAHGELRNSMTRFYKLPLTKFVRKVGSKDVLNERIHASLQKRMRNQTNSYQRDTAFDPGNPDQDGFATPRAPVVTDGIDLVKAARQATDLKGWISKVFRGQVTVKNEDIQD